MQIMTEPDPVGPKTYRSGSGSGFKTLLISTEDLKNLPLRQSVLIKGKPEASERTLINKEDLENLLGLRTLMKWKTGATEDENAERKKVRPGESSEAENPDKKKNWST